MISKKHLMVLLTTITTIGSLNAQIKVTTGGKTSIGYAGTPPSKAQTHLVKNTLFSASSSGTGAMIKGVDGLSATNKPDYTWYSDTTTGILHPAASTIGFSISGNEKIRLDANGNTTFSSNYNSLTSGLSAAIIRGQSSMSTAALPDYTWWGNDLTGIFHPVADVIGISINSSEKMRIHSNGFVGIGSTAPASLLSVGGNGNSLYSAYIYNSSTATGTAGLYGTIATPTGTNTGAALYGSVTSGTGYAHGVKGVSYNTSAQTYGQAYGVYGEAGNATTGYNYGVAGNLIGSNNGAGVFGGDNSYGISLPGKYAGYFAGKIRTTNDAPEKPTGGSWTGYSDGRLKKDTVGFKDGLSVLRRIHPITYKFNGIGDLSSTETHIGVIAQEIQQIAPYCVSTGKILLKQSEVQNFSADVVQTLAPDSTGETRSIVNALTYNYDALIYVLINSVKQLDSTVAALQVQETNNEELQRQLDSLKHAVDDCCNRGIKTSTVEVNSRSTSNPEPETTKPETSNWLAQNKPNPFNKETVIEYSVVQEGKGSIMIFDMNGKLLKTIPVKIPGKGSITINANDFIAGMYYYSLVVNDVEVDTKKMILTE